MLVLELIVYKLISVLPIRISKKKKRADFLKPWFVSIKPPSS